MVSRQKPFLNTYSCRSFTAAISQTFSADTADSASRFDGHFRYFTNLLPLYRRRRLRASAAISETLPPRSPYSEPFNRSHVVELFVNFGASLGTRAGIYLDGRERLTGHRSTTIPVAVRRVRCIPLTRDFALSSRFTFTLSNSRCTGFSISFVAFAEGSTGLCFSRLPARANARFPPSGPPLPKGRAETCLHSC